MHTQRALAAILLVASVVFGATSEAGAGAALTNWKTFGSAVATGREWASSPTVSVDSTTLRDPQVIRFVLSGTAPDVSVNWNLYCFNASGFDTRYVSGSRDDVNLPFTKSVGGTWIRDYDYCNLDVWAFSIDEGKIKLREQAKYGA